MTSATGLRHSLTLALALAWGLFGSLAPVAGEVVSEPEPRRLTLLVTSGLAGRLVAGGQTIAGLAAEIRRLADAARERGDAVAIFDAGRTFLPYAESRYDEGRTMARVLAHAGCQAFAPDAMDLTLGLWPLAELASDAPFPVLRPFDGADPKLEAFASHAVFEPSPWSASRADEPPLRLVLVSVFDDFYAGNLAKSGIAALLVPAEDRLKAIPEGEPALRVAVVHSAAVDSSMLSRKVTWKLVEKPLGYDLLIDPDFGRDVILQDRTENGSVLLIGRKQERQRPWTVAEIVIDLERPGGRWQPAAATLEVHEIDPSTEPDRDLEGQIIALVDEFRDASSQQLPKAPTDEEELRRFVLRTLREEASAEVAILNLGAFHDIGADLLERPSLTVEEIRRLLPLDQYVVVGELTGSQLAGLVSASNRRKDGGRPLRSSLVFEGLDPGNRKVNGRKLYPEDRYRVVTNSFLASGGDDYPALTRLERSQTLRLSDGRLGEVREDYVLPRLEAPRDFTDLNRRGLWRYGVDRVGLSFEGVETSADDAYLDTVDSRASAVASASLLATVRLRADQQWRSFHWQNRLRGRFGLIDAEGADRSELEDDLRLEISGLFTETNVLGGQLYASLIADSEFRRNTRRGVKLPRQLEFNLAAGLRWQAGPWPLIRFGLVARHQEDFEDADRFGLFTEAELDLVAQGRRPRLTGRFFAESLDNAAATIRRLDAELAFHFEIADALTFTPEINYYLYDDSRLPGSARYYRLSLGLAYAWAGKHQRLRPKRVSPSD